MQPRLADVARLAGVSTATVSRVLNQPAAVTPQLRTRVQTAVDDLGYVPHGPARALASRRSNTIGAVVPTIDNAIFAHNIQSVQARLFELTVEDVKQRNRAYSQDEVLDAIDEALVGE